jgi:hypothetical protein
MPGGARAVGGRDKIESQVQRIVTHPATIIAGVVSGLLFGFVPDLGRGGSRRRPGAGADPRADPVECADPRRARFDHARSSRATLFNIEGSSSTTKTRFRSGKRGSSTSYVSAKTTKKIIRGVGQVPDIASKTPTRSARDTSSARDRTCIFSITFWRWALMVRWAAPNITAICLLV